MLLEVVKGGPALLQFFAMIIDITQVLLNDDTFGCQLPMESGINGGIKGNIIVGHDTSTAIDDTMLTKRLVLQ